MLDSAPYLRRITFPPLQRGRLETLQLNLGYRCNLRCTHCHVNAGPSRSEVMSRESIDWVVRVLEQGEIVVLDLTGGAPELNPHFRDLVSSATALGVRVIDRCNLAVLQEPGQEDLALFLASQRVEVVASMPCYLQENVDRQRGSGVFDASIEGLRQLNRLGYGALDSGLILNLVYNPQDAALPPSQQQLERDYREVLWQQYGVQFNQLLTLANLPIQRFGGMLLAKGMFDDYMALLQAAHQPQNLETVMCRTLISADWQGVLYDCDFNQMLKMPLRSAGGHPLHLRDLLVDSLEQQPIQVGGHCYGCTAGQGSSCGGALSR